MMTVLRCLQIKGGHSPGEDPRLEAAPQRHEYLAGYGHHPHPSQALPTAGTTLATPFRTM